MDPVGTSSLLFALPLVVLGSSGANGAASGPLNDAVARLQYGDWVRAFETLVPLADTGDCEAARLSLMMHQHGGRLFGGSFPATRAQSSRWLALGQV